MLYHNANIEMPALTDVAPGADRDIAGWFFVVPASSLMPVPRMQLTCSLLCWRFLSHW